MESIKPAFGGGPARSTPVTFNAMASTSHDGLLSEDQVAAESGLAGPLVSTLIPRAAAITENTYSSEAAVYDEVGLWRAKVAKLLLNHGIRMDLVHLAVREPLSLQELRATVAGGLLDAPVAEPRRSGLRRYAPRWLARNRHQ